MRLDGNPHDIQSIPQLPRQRAFPNLVLLSVQSNVCPKPLLEGCALLAMIAMISKLAMTGCASDEWLPAAWGRLSGLVHLNIDAQDTTQVGIISTVLRGAFLQACESHTDRIQCLTTRQVRMCAAHCLQAMVHCQEEQTQLGRHALQFFRT